MARRYRPNGDLVLNGWQGAEIVLRLRVVNANDASDRLGVTITLSQEALMSLACQAARNKSKTSVSGPATAKVKQ